MESRGRAHKLGHGSKSVSVSSYSTSTGGSNADAAYNAIIDLIFQHKLRPGERTSVVLLSQRIGLGRTPIKEAITRLQTEGVLSVTSSSGTIINEFTEDQAKLIFSLRSTLEDYASPAIVKNITPSEVADLKELVRQMRVFSLEHSEPSNVASFVRANVNFHRALIAGAKNPYLDRMFAQIQIHQQILLYLQHRGFERKAAIQRQAEHEAILKAVAAKDARKLKSVLRRHSDAALVSILKM
jgi:DNA-binding GntR family transcriptional regulator